MSRIATFCDWLLRSPIIWGVMAWTLFDTLVRRFGGEWLNSYFTETPLHQITTAMFCVGMATLLIRALGVLGQFGVLQRQLLDPITLGGQPVTDAPQLAEQLAGLPSWLRSSYLVQRLESALDYVARRQSADSLEQQLRTLEEADYNRMSAGYAMVRVITGVVPILGFLGTVIGITIAIARLSPEQLESSLDAVIAGLSVAFDTTALALALSILLVFSKLIVERLEESLLAKTTQRAYQELVGRFEEFGTASDPHVSAISRMCDQVVRSVEVMAARQADLWKSTIDETHEQWAKTTAAAGQQLNEAVTTGLAENLKGHATDLTAGVESQLARLNASVAGQTESLAEAVQSQTSLLTDAAATQHNTLAASIQTQSAAVAASIEQNLTTLNAAVAEHREQLGAGATELLGNLRDGLERMAELLVEALQKHGQTLTQAEEELASENRRHLSEVEAALGEAMVVAADRQEKLIGRSEELLQGMQSSVAESAAATVSHQEQLVKQGEVLLKVVESTGQVQALQDALNQNLNALSRGQNLEETLLSLSAAIQLLSARTGRPVADLPTAKNQAA